MTFLNRRIRAVYAGALGALGLALGSALDPLSAQSQGEQAAQKPIYLKAARPAAKTAPVRLVTVERKIDGRSIDWWRARVIANQRTINRLRAQPGRSGSSSNQSSNSSSNQSSNSNSNSSSNQSNNSSSNSSSNSG